METKRSLTEAIFRAHNSTGKVTQPQQNLYAMGNPEHDTYMHNAHHAPLNESHVNLMQSWMNLRGMDCKLAESKYSDLSVKRAS
jgi:hypothetical protein